MKLRTRIAGCGAYLPERVLTNHELAARLETSDDWIRQRTGIGERRIAADGELTSDLAVGAARRALSDAGMSGSDLDLIALAPADNALRLGQARVALVIGAETFSRILDWEDRGTCVLFGDGAGALAL